MIPSRFSMRDKCSLTSTEIVPTKNGASPSMDFLISLRTALYFSRRVL